MDTSNISWEIKAAGLSSEVLFDGTLKCSRRHMYNHGAFGSVATIFKIMKTYKSQLLDPELLNERNKKATGWTNGDSRFDSLQEQSFFLFSKTTTLNQRPRKPSIQIR